MPASSDTQTKRQRTCIACGGQGAKGGLLRVVRTPQGAVQADLSGRMPGRGAYVCSEECLQTACRTRRFDRALKTKLTDEDYERVAAEARAALIGRN